MILDWKNHSNIEFSLYKFINDSVTSDNLQVIDEEGNAIDVNVVVGKNWSKNWSLPIIQIYLTSQTATRLSIGSNKRQRDPLLTIDIRGLMPGQEKDLATYIIEIINNGFPFIQFAKNTGDPDSPLETNKGTVSIDFVTDSEVISQEDDDLIDKYRWRITINCQVPELD